MNAAFTKTNVAIAANFQSPPETYVHPMIQQLQAMSPPVGLTFPDLIPQFINEDVSQGESWPMDQDAYNMIRGDLSGSNGGVTSQSIGQPVFARAETSELGGSIHGSRREDGIATALGGRGYVVWTLRDFADFTLKASHICMPHNDDFATILDQQKWTSAALVEFAKYPNVSSAGYPY
ncbi:MAG: hypothetical protein JRI23_30840 [Deltaproteobacteria bacterium]|jgi:hypothetical protein|nr:hypothetical protein [Deltaproteobacteria bacterium]MBW2536595.1 hypothetical protein [Deltaproteobacteria bacterium]